ncbi:MAG: ABC-F family ATP-binding cassette domain-containing protein [Phycisphaerales bacterium]|nr:ABC-F family ATP-binding cassette domain-containing protein [Phycisphaerales bacterium]
MTIRHPRPRVKIVPRPESPPMSRPLELMDVAFGYEGSGQVLFDGVRLRFDAGWSGIVGVNGSGKTTLLRLIDRTLVPRRGSVVGPEDVVVCPQRTDDPPDALGDFLHATDRDAFRLRGRLEVGDDWRERWATLSHGERKRAQIGAALWRRPDVLALDEPTNHVDAPTRALLRTQLASYRGIGLLVSHDRELLDALCRQCVFLDGAGVTVRRGGYTDAAAQNESEQDAAERVRDEARRERKRLRQVAADRQREASRADARRSKRRIGAKDHDAKARIDAARVSGKDGQAGRQAAQLAGHLQRADERMRDAAVDRRRTLGLTMRGEVARADAVWRTEPTTIALGADRRLDVPELVLRPDDRVGIRGPNGAGKSTLVRRIVAETTRPDDRLVVLEQEIDRDASRGLHATLLALPAARRGEVLATIDCLGSDPVRLLETETPSPGESRKLALALGLARRPHLIIMDEPTNHLDLPSIECLEHALAACTCALVLVSHDDRFLDALTRRTWRVGDGRVTIEATIAP